jgi:hypothetical protein
MTIIITKKSDRQIGTSRQLIETKTIDTIMEACCLPSTPALASIPNRTKGLSWNTGHSTHDAHH